MRIFSESHLENRVRKNSGRLYIEQLTREFEKNVKHKLKRTMIEVTIYAQYIHNETTTKITNTTFMCIIYCGAKRMMFAFKCSEIRVLYAVSDRFICPDAQFMAQGVAVSIDMNKFAVHFVFLLLGLYVD